MTKPAWDETALIAFADALDEGDGENELVWSAVARIRALEAEVARLTTELAALKAKQRRLQREAFQDGAEFEFGTTTGTGGSVARISARRVEVAARYPDAEKPE